MKIGFTGLGKLGLPSALAMESKGHTVFGVDPSPQTTRTIVERKLPYLEELAPELLAKSQIELVSTEYLVREADLIFVAVQTPHEPAYEGITPIPESRADFNYAYLCQAVEQLCQELQRQNVVKDIVIISTVLPGTMRRFIRPIIQRYGQEKNFRLLYNPFFIAMGTVVHDVLHPEFVLLGADQTASTDRIINLYRSLHDRPLFATTVENAELIKVIYNTFIGMKIAFANTVMEICHKTPATDCDTVIAAISKATDRLISSKYLRGGMGDGGACLPVGELVMTETGPRPIETIEVGSRVLSSDGVLKRVVKVWKRNYSGELITVRAEGMPPSRFTSDHSLYAAEDGRDWYTTGGKKKRVSVATVAEKLQSLREISAGDLELGEFIPQVRPRGDQVCVPVHVTPAYCEIAGWYLSEGSVELSTRRGRTTFSLNAAEEPIGQWLLELCQEVAPQPQTGRSAGEGGCIAVEGSRCSVRYGSKLLAEQLASDFGQGAHAKVVPSWVVYGPEWVAKLVMRGMWQGDGCSSGGINLSSTSPDIAYAGLLLLSRFGVTASLRNIPPRIGSDGTLHARAYEVRVRNTKDLAVASELTGREPPSRGDHKLYTRYPEREGTRYRKVSRISRERYRGEVWNLWVDGEDHTFTTNIGWVSNCHPRDNIALSWLARELKLSHDLFYDIMVARQDQTRWLADLIQQNIADLPVVLLGKAFKPNTNIVTGSPALLLSHYLHDNGVAHAVYDPHVDNDPPPGHPALYFISTAHKLWRVFDFPPGSVVLDPFRDFHDNASLSRSTYIPIGVSS